MPADAAPAYSTTLDELRASGRAVRDTYEAYRTELERRDELVTDALDQGIPQTAVASAVGVSKQRVAKLTLPRSDR